MIKIHPQMIIKNSFPEFVILSYKEYEAILDAIETQKDIEIINDFHTNSNKIIPFELLQSITKGKNAVQAFREFNNISQAKLAKKIGISRQYLHQIENKKRQGTSKILKKIAKVLNIDVDLLIAENP